MATKTFSSRAEESSLAFADALARREYGLSFGQYCGTVLLDAIESMGSMPQLECRERRADKERAVGVIKGFAARAVNPVIGHMSDGEIRDLVAGRYE